MTGWRLGLLVTVAMTVWLVAGVATAQSACAPRDAILERLESKYGEVPVAAGVTDRALLIEVLVSGDGGTWTIIATSAAGASCLIAAGEGWRDVAVKPRGPRT